MIWVKRVSRLIMVRRLERSDTGKKSELVDYGEGVGEK